VYVYKTVYDCMLLIGFDFVGGVQITCARVTKQRDDIVLRGGHSAISLALSLRGMWGEVCLLRNTRYF